MSGVDMLGAISAVINIIDASVKIYDGARRDLELPETFCVTARQLPILADTLTTDTLESWEGKARNLRTVFEKVITTDKDGWDKRYVKAVRKMGKAHKAEDLMAVMLKDMQLVVTIEPYNRQRLSSAAAGSDPGGSAGTGTTNRRGYRDRDKRHNLVVLSGLGKTQLAIAYTEAHQADYDSIFWFNATSEATFKVSLKSMANQIFNVRDLEELTGEHIVAGGIQWLSDAKNSRWLLIFDNYDVSKSYELETYYPQTLYGPVIPTTRLPNGWEQKH